jgi:hypothetical protein
MHQLPAKFSATHNPRGITGVLYFLKQSEQGNLSVMKRKIDFDTSNSSSRSGKGFDAEAGDGTNPWTGKPLTKRYFEILEKRKQLPVYEFKDALIKAVKDNQVVIVEVMQHTPRMRANMKTTLLKSASFRN